MSKRTMTLEDKIDVIYDWVLAQKKEQGEDICEFIAEPNYTEIAEDVLKDIGVPRSTNGFNYTIWAVEQIIMGRHDLQQVTKNLYYDGAKHFGVDVKAFERGIRRAIDSTLRRNPSLSKEAIRIFGDEQRAITITNKAFIATLASEVKKRKKYRMF